MDFSEALRHAKAAFKVTRTGWGEVNMYVTSLNPENSNMSEPYLYLVNTHGGFAPWTPTQFDLFADDWVISV